MQEHFRGKISQFLALFICANFGLTTGTLAAEPQTVQSGGLVVDFVLVVLVLMSIGVWIIGLYRLRFLVSLRNKNTEFRDFFWRHPELERIASQADANTGVPFAELFQAAYRTWRMAGKLAPEAAQDKKIQQVERSIHAELDAVVSRLENWSGFLATTASSAPFIGLFGTVWGILQSFSAIGQMKSASLAVVAPGLSEALIATAVGLVAAIPAAVFYNLVLRSIEKVRVESETFAADLTNILSSLPIDTPMDGR